MAYEEKLLIQCLDSTGYLPFPQSTIQILGHAWGYNMVTFTELFL